LAAACRSHSSSLTFCDRAGSWLLDSGWSHGANPAPVFLCLDNCVGLPHVTATRHSGMFSSIVCHTPCGDVYRNHYNYGSDFAALCLPPQRYAAGGSRPMWLASSKCCKFCNSGNRSGADCQVTSQVTVDNSLRNTNATLRINSLPSE
jgi:hypothetical protein